MTEPTRTPLLTLLVPTLNEEADIVGCIEVIGRQTYPLSRVELIVIDGCSTDSTVERVARAADRFAFARLVVLENPRRRTSVGLNIGLAQAQGVYIARVDARSRIAPDYLEVTVGLLRDRPEIGVVGGAQRAEPRSNRPLDIAVARALRNRWSTGLSRYRRALVSQPSDTVWMGVFRTEELRELGGWAEAVALNEDYDLNSRYAAGGWLAWFEASLQSGYLARRSLQALSAQYFYFGRLKGTWWARGRHPAGRQLVLLGLPLAGAAATVAAARRVGWRTALCIAPAGLLALDTFGGAGLPAAMPVRAASAGVIGLYTASWWVGVWVGVVGELAGVKHRHG